LAPTLRVNGLYMTLADLGDYPMPIYDGDVEAKSGARQRMKLRH
jgi:hypothetical protein